MVEWHVAGRFSHVSISNDSKTYSIDACSVAMALLEIARTINAAAEKAESKRCRRLMADKRWQRKFEDPIPLPDGTKAHHDAGRRRPHHRPAEKRNRPAG